MYLHIKKESFYRISVKLADLNWRLCKGESVDSIHW